VKPFLFLAALAVAAPALAQTHEPVATALSGRSPHTMMRQIAATPISCDAVRASTPSGRQPTAHRPGGCVAAQLASRDLAERQATGR